MLAARWLDELKQLVPVAPNDIFPGDQLLGHMPALIEELAAFFRAPAHESIAANAVVTARATELGQSLAGSGMRNVTRMHETLGKLVALARSAEGADSALVQRLDLAAIISDVVGQLREMADARHVDVRVASPLPSVTIDAARLELVLVNLISNAIKYSDPNKPVRFVEITSVPSARPDVCTVSIRDNGIGIAEADLGSIFARFYRGRPERDRELGTSGLGLGLSIVADCVDALKGDIRVESAPGEGTTFFLELPSGAEA